MGTSTLDMPNLRLIFGCLQICARDDLILVSAAPLKAHDPPTTSVNSDHQTFVSRCDKASWLGWSRMSSSHS
eukprot:2063218-Amphidinium_carterae.1